MADNKALAKWLANQKPDRTANGYYPEIGEHVRCTRLGAKPIEGVVEENRMGLFLCTDDGENVVLTASLWEVAPSPEFRLVDDDCGET